MEPSKSSSSFYENTWLGVAMHACIPDTEKNEVVTWQAEDQSGLHSKALSQKSKRNAGRSLSEVPTKSIKRR